MNIEKIREEFEAWVKIQDWNIDMLYRDGYVAWESQFAFDAWQASRESLVIELPASPYMPDSDPESMTGYEIGEAQGRCDMWASVREAIEASGLKVNP